MDRAMVSFSFDDGREDTYRVAYKIMKDYGLVGTIHVTTGWVDGTWSPPAWPSAVMGAMSVGQIRECHRQGFEITSHGDRHVTAGSDLELSLTKLQEWGVLEPDCIGFSSPNSLLTAANSESLKELFAAQRVAYARSGRAAECYAGPRKVIYFLQLLTGSKGLFRIFNSPNSIQVLDREQFILPATVIKPHNSADQVIELLEKSVPSRAWNILMFHSILRPEDRGYGRDAWYWDSGEFSKLCRWLSGKVSGDLAVVTIKDGLRMRRMMRAV